MEDVFAPGGALERALSQVGDAEYEPRREQAALAAAVERALATGQHLVAEAGTGVGKSLAYLVPALESGLRVVVATATKALQASVGGFPKRVTRRLPQPVLRTRVVVPAA